MNDSLRKIIYLLIAGSILLLAACSKPVHAPEELIEVKVCRSSISANSVFLEYAEEKQLFEKYGLDVAIFDTEGGSNATKGLFSGGYDLCIIGGSALANAAVAGGDLIIVSGIISQLPYSLVTLPEITEAEQLRGQKLAISDFGGSSDTAVRIALENVNLDPEEDVVIMSIGGQSARMAALLSGSVAGTVVSVPESSKAKELGFNTLLDLSETGQPYQHTAVATRGEVVENEREMVLRFVKAVTEAIALMQKDREGTIDTLAEYLLLDKEKDAAFLEEAYDILVLKYYDPYPSVEGMEYIIELKKAGNPEAEGFSAADIVDESFMNELGGSGFLDNLSP